jgi:hypothetical protein
MPIAPPPRPRSKKSALRKRSKLLVVAAVYDADLQHEKRATVTNRRYRKQSRPGKPGRFFRWWMHQMQLLKEDHSWLAGRPPPDRKSTSPSRPPEKKLSALARLATAFHD